MRRHPHNQSDPRKNSDDQDAERKRQGGIDPDSDPDAEPQRVSRRPDNPDEAEEIDLADDDVEELSEMEEEAEARKGDGPDA